VSLEVEEAATSHAPAIAHVHRLSRASYYGVPIADADDGREAMWVSLLAEPARRTLVAHDDGGVVAFASMVRSAARPGDLELAALYVLPDHFGRGVGSLLHAEFERERGAGERGVLEVWAANTSAVGFYRRRGWRPTTSMREGPQNRPFVTWVLQGRGPIWQGPPS
jgi:ribosomal protein S18 acetylase RimI-like enzyme